MASEASLLKGGGLGLHVVDKGAMRFVETGQMHEDSFDIDWGSTPEPAARERAPAPPPRPRTQERIRAPEPPPAEVAGPSDEAMPHVFPGVNPRQLQQAMDSFEVFDVHVGETLIQQGEKQPALLLVLRGQVAVERHGRIRRAQAGSVLGLTTLFGDGIWPVGLKTLTDCRVMILELDRYRELRSRGSVVSQALEEYALDQLLQELERNAKDVGAYLNKQPAAELFPQKGFFARMTAAIGGGGIRVVSLDKANALAGSPLFRNAEPAQLAAIGTRMEAIRVQMGELLCTEGEPSSHLYVLVDGAVDVIVSSGDKAAIKHQTLEAGDAFGAWSVLRTAPNWASYVVTEKSTLLELDKLGWTELTVSGDAVSSVLRLALIRSLASRVAHSRSQLAAQAMGLKPTFDEVGEELSSFVTINPASRR